MAKRRIESTTSRTAEMTCLSRAASSLETNRHYHSDDDLAVRLLPGLFRVLLHIPLFRAFYCRVLAPAGIYEYVIGRTKYIDAVFKQALSEQFDQILLFGAGHVGFGDEHFEQQPQDVDEDVPFTTGDFLGRIVPSFAGDGGGLDRLAIHDRGTGLGLALLLFSYRVAQCRVQLFPYSRLAPISEIAVDCLPRREVVR
jgi:hypothetical protein